MEYWLPVRGNDNYLVSNEGNVYSLLTKKQLKLCVRDGYYEVNLQRKTSRVHRLVADAWVPGDRTLHVCHNDGNRLNNNARNLRWDSQAENNRDIVRMGRHNNVRKTHCPAGHEYSQDNTRYNKSGSRYCLQCRRDRRVKRGSDELLC